jgi:hypothetical protein
LRDRERWSCRCNLGTRDDRQPHLLRDLDPASRDCRREARAEHRLMCPLYVVTALVRLLLVVACLTLSLFMPNVITGLGVWPLIWLAWDRVPYEERISTSAMLQLLPFAIAVQVALDSLVPFVGDITVLLGNVLIVAVLRRPKLPKAWVVRRTK